MIACGHGAAVMTWTCAAKRSKRIHVRRRLALPLLISFALLLAGAAPVFADHPGIPAQQIGQEFHGADGEAWVVIYDPEWGELRWEPADPDGEGPDTVGSGTEVAYAPGTDDEYHFTLSRIAFISGNVYTGSDGDFRAKNRVDETAYWFEPLYRPAGGLGVDSQLLYWNGSSWIVSRDSGWRFSTATSNVLTPTFSWGPAPSGAGYYKNKAYVAHTSNTAPGGWSVCGPVYSGQVYVSGGMRAFSAGARVHHARRRHKKVKRPAAGKAKPKLRTACGGRS